jgi:hypothetical protein
MVDFPLYLRFRDSNSEAVYDRGIHMEQPGSSHLGRPEQIVKLGRTELPKNIIMDYLESMSLVYTAEVGLAPSLGTAKAYALLGLRPLDQQLQ